MKLATHRVYAVLAAISLVTANAGCENMENVDPIIVTSEVQNIGSSSASIGGELVDKGARSQWQYGFVWSDTAFPNISNGSLIDLGTRGNPGKFSVLLENLNSDQQYYYRAWVADPGFRIIFYGGQQQFSTLP